MPVETTAAKPIRVAATGERAQRPLLGAVLLCSALLLFAAQDVLVKDASERVPVIEILTLRIAIVAVALLLLTRLSGASLNLQGRQQAVLLTRGILAFFAFTAYYMALARLPMATTSAVYMSAPLLVTAWSVPLLGESVGARRWFAVIAGFAGVLIIINPGADLFQPAVLLPVISALCYSLIPIITRSSGRAAPGLVMATISSIAYLGCCLVLCACIVIWPAASDSTPIWRAIAEDWVVPQWRDGWQIFLAGLVFSAAMFLIAEAYRQAPVSTVAPFEYSYLIWSVALGYLAFGDIPATRVLAGAAVIITCGLYVMHRERRHSNVATDVYTNDSET